MNQLPRSMRPGRRIIDIIDSFASRSVGEVLAGWLLMVLGFGVAYRLVTYFQPGDLLSGGQPVAPSWDGFFTCLYFSCVTATSVGYGDVVPVAVLRLVAMVEATCGLLVFGFVVAKFLSRRQEQVMDEIHRIAFEDRLGRVQTNLHMVLAELQSVVADCTGHTASQEEALARAESVSRVFTSELRTIHDLLYRPQQPPDEEILAGILAGLASAMRQQVRLGQCLSTTTSPSLERSLHSISRLAANICGECVPRDYTPALKEIMNEIQKLAIGLGSRSAQESVQR